MRLSPRTVDLIHSPIGAAHSLLDDRQSDRALLDLSQAAPSFSAAPSVVERIAAVAHEPDGGRYAPQPGLARLREAFAHDLSLGYGTAVEPANTLITAGCNQAFCLAASALTEPGDHMVLVDPFYFNHDMWLRVEGVEVAHLRTGDDQLPDPELAAALLTDRTRAIVLVSPGNPTGVTYEPDRIHAFAALARSRGIALIVDETYRNFRPDTRAAPHELFADPQWVETVVSLHSFSKDFAIPGYRVGGIVAGEPLLVEALKLLDCVAISAPRIGMEAAWAGLTTATDWRRQQAERIRDLQRRFEAVMSQRPGGFEVVTAGAYFGWVRHPFTDATTDEVLRRLVHEADTLVIPGTAFTLGDERMLRFSFANLSADEVDELGVRLAELN